MTITISKGYDNTYVMLRCHDYRFRRHFGIVDATMSTLFKEMERISDYVNNVLREDCLFEVE